MNFANLICIFFGVQLGDWPGMHHASEFLIMAMA